MDLLVDFLLGVNLSVSALALRTLLIKSVVICCVALILCYGVFRMIKRYVRGLGNRRGKDLAIVLRESHLMIISVGIVVCTIVLLVAQDLYPSEVWFLKTASIVLIVLLVYLVHRIGKFVDLIYKQFEVAKTRPITAFIQVLDVVMILLGGVWIVSLITGENTGTLMVSVSALFAALSFVFKDTILNFVAGIQLTTSDMIQIGDRVKVDDQVDGFVDSININSVKIRNFDQTTTVVPASRLLNNPFTNYRHLDTLSIRRFSRTLLIDTKTVVEVSEAMLVKAEAFGLTEPGDHHTNLFVYRDCIYHSLAQHQSIAHDQSLSVVIKDPTSQGIPLQILGFTAFSDYDAYDLVTRELMDEWLLMLRDFELQIYQSPSGSIE